MADSSLLEEKLGFGLENIFHNVGYHNQCSKKHSSWINKRIVHLLTKLKPGIKKHTSSIAECNSLVKRGCLIYL